MQEENAATVIGESILVTGHLSGDEDMTVLGRVEGRIDLTSTLFVANDGIVKADVNVGNAVISGIVIGNVTAEQSVQITETGRLVGDLRAPRVVITAGARVRGQVDMGGEATGEQRQELSAHNQHLLPAARESHRASQASADASAAALARSPSGRFQRLSLPQRRPLVPMPQPVAHVEATRDAGHAGQRDERPSFAAKAKPQVVREQPNADAARKPTARHASKSQQAGHLEKSQPASHGDKPRHASKKTSPARARRSASSLRRRD